jgi:hypothetical protein
MVPIHERFLNAFKRAWAAEVITLYDREDWQEKTNTETLDIVWV